MTLKISIPFVAMCIRKKLPSFTALIFLDLIHSILYKLSDKIMIDKLTGFRTFPFYLGHNA